MGHSWHIRTTKICSIAFSSLDFENCTLWKGYFVDEVGNVADVIQCRLLLFDIKILQNFIKHQALTLCTIQWNLHPTLFAYCRNAKYNYRNWNCEHSSLNNFKTSKLCCTVRTSKSTFQSWDQRDQIGRFIGLWATFQSMWQQLVCPNLPYS